MSKRVQGLDCSCIHYVIYSGDFDFLDVPTPRGDCDYQRTWGGKFPWPR